MQKYFVYILKSDLGYSYIGQTANLEDRLQRHNSDRSTFTKQKGTWHLIAKASVTSLSEAVQLERKLKNFKKAEKQYAIYRSLV